ISEAGLCPTSTTTNPGGRPRAASASTRGFSSLLMSSRTRFPSRIRGILLNHNVGRCRSVTSDVGRRRELVAQGLGGGPGVLAFHMGVEAGGDLEELAVAWFPDFEKRARVETALHGPSLVEALFEGLADRSEERRVGKECRSR